MTNKQFFTTVDKKKFIICIDPIIRNEIEKSNYIPWINKYRFLIKINWTDESSNCNFSIKLNDEKYMTNLKKSFDPWIKNNLLYEKNYIWLNDRNLGINYHDHKNNLSEKTRPFFISEWGTKQNNKVILFPITSTEGKYFKEIKISNRVSYINCEEPVTKTKKQVLKFALDVDNKKI